MSITKINLTKALTALYLEVDSSIADDIKQKVLEALSELEDKQIYLEEKIGIYTQCLHGLNASLDEYWNAKHRGEKEIKKITQWQQNCKRELDK